jgi:transposase-like protein
MGKCTSLGSLRQSLDLLDDLEGVRHGDLSGAVAGTVKALLEGLAVSEVEHRVGFKLYERGSSDAGLGERVYRNGWRERQVQLPFMTLTIQIPRLRSGGFVPSFLEPGHRAIADVEKWVARGFVCGLSRSEICRFMEATCGLRPSDGVLSRVQAQLDVRAKAFKERRLVDEYEYLFLDAAWVKDIVGTSAARVCVLTAVGITKQGEKQVLGFERASQETESSWRGFLTRLKERGLRTTSLRLVISDEHQGLVKAVPETLGDVPHQLCWAHRVRNIVDAVAKSDRKAVVEGMRHIYRSQTTPQARTAIVLFKAKWASIYPSVLASLEQDLRHLLAFLEMPVEHQEYVRTTNPIERLFVELRRRRYGCGAFANRLACDRVLYAVYELMNTKWHGKDIWFARKQKAKRTNA